MDSQPADFDQFLTVNEVAAIVRVNQMTVRNWIDRGELAAVRVGARRVRIRRSDFDAFLATAPKAGRQPRPSQTETIVALQDRVEELTARLEALERNNDDGNA